MEKIGFGIVIVGILVTFVAEAILQKVIRAAPSPQQESLVLLRRKYLRLWVLVGGLVLYFGAQRLAQEGRPELWPVGVGVALTVIFGNDVVRQLQLRRDRRALGLPPELLSKTELHTWLRITTAALLPVGAALYLLR